MGASLLAVAKSIYYIMSSTFHKVKKKLNKILALFRNGYSVYLIHSVVSHPGADDLSSTTKTAINVRKKRNDFVLFNKEKQNQRKVRPSAPQAYQCKVTHSIGTATQMQLEVILAGNRIAISLSHPLLVKQRQLKSQ